MALPDVLKPSPYMVLSTGITNQQIASGSSYTGSEIDNTDNRYALCVVELIWSYATAPTANKTLEVHRLRCHDGTNYEELSNRTLIAAVSPPADTSSHQRTLLEELPLLAAKYKFAIKNVDTGQTVTASLKVYAYNYRIEE